MEIFKSSFWTKKADKKFLRIFYTISAIILSIVFYYSYRRDKYIEKMLQNTDSTYAIITDVKNGGPRSSKRCKYFYFVKGKKYDYETRGDFTFLKEGDTILIRYSIGEPSIATVENPSIMSRFKN